MDMENTTSRWSTKTPRLTSHRSKNCTPRNNVMCNYDEDYSFAYETVYDSECLNTRAHDEIIYENEDLKLDFDSYFVAADIEELILKSQETVKGVDANTQIKLKKKNKRKDEKNTKKTPDKQKKYIRFSLSRPPSPKTEQVIRVDVTSNVSFGGSSETESNLNLFKVNQTCRNHKQRENKHSEKMEHEDFRNNKHKENKHFEKMEHDNFSVRCKQVALTQKVV
ncbi:uncharacterized protein LOC115878754 isoform X2 [Sitophilus oryzae]|uniref:Uncharacterized protein LOC115878754 isoform X2 n=1 Tax=Sitophilus oryzae TaxID=7048 RepID=A0A6J2XKN0_SITOR|nr:uncharacterized protein LOC115878754 isoform X2 [Sitophilus oryzae]